MTLQKILQQIPLLAMTFLTMYFFFCMQKYNHGDDMSSSPLLLATKFGGKMLQVEKQRRRQMVVIDNMSSPMSDGNDISSPFLLAAKPRGRMFLEKIFGGKLKTFWWKNASTMTCHRRWEPTTTCWRRWAMAMATVIFLSWKKLLENLWGKNASATTFFRMS